MAGRFEPTWCLVFEVSLELGCWCLVLLRCLVLPLCVNWPEHCAVIIPCRNEARFIAKLVREVRALLPNVIVVNDASTDATAEQAASAGAEVISHQLAQGKGAALRTGWNRARERGFAWALCMDGDGQHAPADIMKFLECAERDDAAARTLVGQVPSPAKVSPAPTPADSQRQPGAVAGLRQPGAAVPRSAGASLIVGNRMNEANKMPLVRRTVNRWMSRKLSALAGRELPDSQCGFRLLRLAALDRVQLRATQFEIESEQLLSFIAAGEPVEFVPVQVIYRAERSKIHPLRDTLRWFRWRREWLKSSARRQSGESRNTNKPSRR